MKHLSAWTCIVQLAFAGCAALAQAQPATHPQTGNTVPVTPDNFVRAEFDLFFGNIVKDGGLGKFDHRREPASINNQTVIRPNRDTLYSAAMFDFDAGPVTITLPDAGKRFMSMQVISEDEYTTEVAYGAGAIRWTRRRSARATSWWQYAHWSIRPTRRMSGRFTICRTRSRSVRQVPGGSRCRNGIRQVRRRCGRRF